ncbi:MAG: nucleotidyltransferase domain-containing protein [Candidatus Micrarchaeota archaeon]|nr:nucleotidyltransferase domain-containing protein [Candidatus Micrarchaeota archaeon]
MFDAGRLIQSETRLKLLTLFLVKGVRASGVRELGRLTDSNPAAVSKELKNLEAAGILARSEEGNREVYSLNGKFEAVRELRGLLSKSTDYAGALRSGLAGIKGIDVAFVFGSFANGNSRQNSDIDLFVIGKPDLGELNRAVQALEAKLGVEIDYVAMPGEELREKKKSGFVKNVMSSGKVFVAGDENELGRIS